MENKKLLEKVNPMFQAQKLASYWLAKTGNTMVQELLERTGFTEDMLPEYAKSSELSQIAGCITAEQRYKMVNYLVLQTKCKNILDLPCGYTSRGIEMARANINYVGTDFPSVIEDVEPVVEKIKTDEAGMLKYVSADVTNFDSLKAAADQLEGEICILTQGLLMYLTLNEKRALCDNVRKILAEHGGCWITQDTEAFPHFLSVNLPLFGAESLKKIMTPKAALDKKADVDISGNQFKTVEEGIRFFEESGLKVERVPFYSDEIEVNSFEKVSEETAEEIKSKLKECFVWKITMDSNFTEKEVVSQEFNINTKLKNDELYIELAGRLDTLSAPEFLSVFEKLNKEEVFGNVHIDMKKLQYISSAGLRVLLIILKSKADRKIFVDNTNDTIKEIFATTGFEDILN